MLGPKNSEEAEVYAIEELLAETQYCIQCVMGRMEVNRSELAKRLGCSPANVTQMLSENSNLTLESIARIFHALGDKLIVKSEYLESRKNWTGAVATYANLDLTWNPENSLIEGLRKSISGTASVLSKRRPRLESLIQSDEPDNAPWEAESMHDYGRAA